MLRPSVRPSVQSKDISVAVSQSQSQSLSLSSSLSVSVAVSQSLTIVIPVAFDHLLKSSKNVLLILFQDCQLSILKKSTWGFQHFQKEKWR